MFGCLCIKYFRYEISNEKYLKFADSTGYVSDSEKYGWSFVFDKAGNYVMLCYVMLCYVMLCYVMLYHVLLCYVMLCYIMLYYVVSCYYISLCTTLHHITLYHISTLYNNLNTI